MRGGRRASMGPPLPRGKLEMLISRRNLLPATGGSRSGNAGAAVAHAAMGMLGRLVRSGPVRTVATEISTRAQDFLHGIDTYTYPGVLPPALGEDQLGYYPTSYGALRRIVQRVPLSPEDVIYDVGCGKGRAVCMFARQPIRRCVGIEYNPRHVITARRNAMRLRGRHASIEVHEGDATSITGDDGTVYFLYNSFGAASVQRWLITLRRSLTETPRQIRIIYANPAHEDVLARAEWLVRIDRFMVPFDVMGEMPVSVWRG